MSWIYIMRGPIAELTLRVAAPAPELAVGGERAQVVATRDQVEDRRQPRDGHRRRAAAGLELAALAGVVGAPTPHRASDVDGAL